MAETPKIPAGIEMMMKTFGFDPIKVQADIAQFGQIMSFIGGSLQRIEANQRRIMSALNIPEQLPDAEKPPADNKGS